MKIRVTQDNIYDGNEGDVMFCPVALALEDAGLVYPSVGDSQARWNGQGPDGWAERQIADLPNEVVRFIHQFDAGGRDDVAPFDFELVAL